jgi:hypothetical protein
MIVTDNRRERHAADEEDEDELERGHLLAGASSHNADHDNEKTVSEDRSKNSTHTLFQESAMHSIEAACISVTQLRSIICTR